MTCAGLGSSHVRFPISPFCRVGVHCTSTPILYADSKLSIPSSSLFFHFCDIFYRIVRENTFPVSPSVSRASVQQKDLTKTKNRISQPPTVHELQSKLSLSLVHQLYWFMCSVEYWKSRSTLLINLKLHPEYLPNHRQLTKDISTRLSASQHSFRHCAEALVRLYCNLHQPFHNPANTRQESRPIKWSSYLGTL